MNSNSEIQEQTTGIVPSDQEGTEAYPGDLVWAFCKCVLEGRWDSVIFAYEIDNYFHKIKINESKDTALHVAVNSRDKELVNKLVGAIIEHEGKELGGKSALRLTNERGDTPLHLAAYRGSIGMCKCIIGENGERKDLIKVRNNRGETPLFCAGLACQKQTFVYLYHASKREVDVPLTNSEGDSILHLAIRREFFAYTGESRGTALHVAVNSGKEVMVNLLVGAIIEHEGEELGDESALRSTNERGDTPLHLAAYRGSIGMCKCIVGENGERKDLIKVLNKKGETPLFCAVLTCQTQTFVYLYHVFKYEDDVPLRNSEGDSILHLAIRREFFDLAVIIIQCYPRLIVTPNNDGVTPLKTLATRPSAFKSGSDLTWWKRILYQCIIVETLDAEEEIESYMDKTGKGMHMTEPKVTIHIENEVKEVAQTHVLPNCVTSLRSVFNTIWSALSGRGLSQLDMLYLKTIKKIKQKHVWGNQLLKAFMENPYVSYTGSTGGQPSGNNDFLSGRDIESFRPKHKKQSTEAETDENDTAYLTAAKNGIVEIVVALQSKLPSVVNESNSNDQNALLLAVKNRQSHVVEELRKLDEKHFYNLIFDVDNMENTVLHLAAVTGNNNEKSLKITGAAMQIVWDLKWYQYIKDLVPEHFMFRKNRDGKTAGEIFKENLQVKNSSEWLKETSESCSVVAALIASVSFATSSTVPGGTEKGKPELEGQPAFDTFAIASLIGLCFSVNALVLFLSILTSQKQAEDFRRNLPMKLLFGMSSLFVSIASMLVSFCAAHFLALKDKYKNILFPIYVATCLPASFYAVMQFPLYVDLVTAIFKKVPKRSYRSDHL